jgi:hypothetical protein
MDDMGGACTCCRGTINEHGVLIQMKKGDYLGDLGVYGKIILN